MAWHMVDSFPASLPPLPLVTPVVWRPIVLRYAAYMGTAYKSHPTTHKSHVCICIFRSVECDSVD
jgi:hypothetical protein